MKQLDILSDFQDTMSGYVFCTTQDSPNNRNTDTSFQSLQLSDLHDMHPSYVNLQSPLFCILEQYLILNNLSNRQVLDSLKKLFLKHKIPIQNQNHKEVFTYDKLQKYLSMINEKETNRRKNGVYYTPQDIIDFILKNTINKQVDLGSLHHKDILDFCFNKTFFEPTCGTGEFLLSVLDIKCQLLQKNNIILGKDDYFKIISSLNGNDINPFSIFIVKLRIFLFTLYHFGKDFCEGLIEVLDNCFDVYDFVTTIGKQTRKYDFIIGNPPYVEDGKSGLNITDKYGNIYANVLKNSLGLLKENGVMGFIVPISFISTPRMSKIRQEIIRYLSDLYILNYSDRPDCLFVGVHQKLSIIIGKKSQQKKSFNIYTSNYQYWYKSERNQLFDDFPVIENEFINNKFIPKLGNSTESHIYQKIQKFDNFLVDFLKKQSNENDLFKVYLNMRCTYWVKAFLLPHLGGEYKTYYLDNHEQACFVMCLLNSSLFWWYWTVVSDCWHITQKEFQFFGIPNGINYSVFINLANNLENKLQNTKEYVGTKQTEYEYKHKFCIQEIQAIDDEINHLYGLTTSESEYIKNFAFQYRVNKNEL